jgi:hypothetical protein
METKRSRFTCFDQTGVSTVLFFLKNELSAYQRKRRLEGRLSYWTCGRLLNRQSDEAHLALSIRDQEQG